MLQAQIGGSSNPGSLRAGINYVFLSDSDSQGLLFQNTLHHYVGKRFGVGVNLGLLSAKNYDEAMQIYTVQNAFYMASVEGTFDLMQNESVAFRLGVGPAVRHRSEISSDPEDQGTQDGSVTHIKTTDIGVDAFIENDFSILRNGVAGGRVGYFYYTKGTAVLSIGIHLGFSF
ncbi:hypothetical protein GCM10007389_02280 [Pontibacter akesuensis]|nr:hypothetical protein GCM10007389_02280 [Pontibacter akesuensis]